MEITLASGQPSQIRISWDAYDPKTEAEIANRLKTVPNIDGAGRRFYAPAIQCERLMTLFPMAQFQYAALCAADKAARDFFDSLIGTGVKLVIDGDKVRAVGDNVSPLVEQLVADRSLALMSLVELERDRAALKSPPTSPQVSGDPGLELIAKGIQNAQKRAEVEAQFRYGKRRGSNKPTQGELFE